MTFVILLLHYGVPYIKSEIKDACKDCVDEFSVEGYDVTINVEEKKQDPVDEYSDDTLEEMK